MEKNLKTALEAAILAGKEILKYYSAEDVELQLKEDNSPLTVADKRANEIINRFLKPTGIPIISEENEEISFLERKDWTSCWIVDPLDGTKEFLNKNDEFTVNIALIHNGKPKLGIIYAPALDEIYFAVVKEGRAYKEVGVSKKRNIDCIISEASELSPNPDLTSFTVAVSRSHINKETEQLIQILRNRYSEVKIVSKGSSLKFCLLAEGVAHYYPRLGPTMEWDTAAGQAICEAVGFSCKFIETGESISYNRENLRNSKFVVSYERQVL